MSLDGPAVDAVDALLVASRALVGVAAHSLADIGDVTLPQFRALVLISSRDRTTVSDLAIALGVHPTTATRLCDRLVRKRLIRRVEAAADRREIELRLAAPGRRLVEQVTSRRRAAIGEIVSRMTRDDLDAAVRGLTAFSEAAQPTVGEVDVFGWEPSP